jgi:hypothetical protein
MQLRVVGMVKLTRYCHLAEQHLHLYWSDPKCECKTSGEARFGRMTCSGLAHQSRWGTVEALAAVIRCGMLGTRPVSWCDR